MFRPRPDSPHRTQYALLVAWLGRVILVTAWVSVYLGIALYHKGVYQADLKAWIIPVTTVLGVILIFDLSLTILSYLRSDKDKGGDAPIADPKTSSPGFASTPATSSAQVSASNINIDKIHKAFV